MSAPMNAPETLSPLKRALLAVQELRARIERMECERAEPLAVVGMGCRFPGGADGPDRLWALLREGFDAVREVPADRWDAEALYDADPDAAGKVSTRWGAFLDGVDRFDPYFWGIAPREAARMDPQQRILLEVAWRALEDAGLPAENLAGSRTGVFVGVHNHSTDYARMQFGDAEGVDTYTGTGTSHAVLAGRLAYLLDLRGPTLSVDTACSSSLVAVHLACRSLRDRESDVVVAAGVNLILSPEFTLATTRMKMLSADGRCKTFDERADGIVRGEGCGAVVLKRLSDALRDGDRVRAVIRGSAINQDGHTNGLTAPSGLAQREVIRAALADARIEPGRVGYVETHGTGTALGDPIEVEALAETVGAAADAAGPCVLGAVKTNLGHTEGAAGIAGLIKAVLCLEHGELPPNLHFGTLNPHISLDGTRLELASEPRRWPRGSAPRVAGVSSFGWSGTNAHVVLEEAPGTAEAEPPEGARREEAPPPVLLPVSARTREALAELAAAYRDRLRAAAASGEAPADLARSAALRRSRHEERLAVVGRTAEELADALDAFLAGTAHARLAAGRVGQEEGGPVFVFCGQGAQWAGMGRGLLAMDGPAAETLRRIDALLREQAGWSLVEELHREPSRLEETEVAQPAIFAVQVALAAQWRAWGVEPTAVVGHSVGEVAAAHVAGALTLEDAVRVIVHRGRLMQRATGLGKMAQVELPATAAERLLEPYAGRLAVAAINAPTVTVLAGEEQALAEVLALLAERGVEHRTLPVNYAFHSPQMEPFRDGLARALRGLQPSDAAVPFYSTVAGEALPGRALDAAYWGRNVREPVRFVAAVDAALADGHERFLEVGPHPVLAVPLARCLAHRGRQGAPLASLRRDRDEATTLLVAAGALWTGGERLEWNALAPAGRTVPLPVHPFRTERFWIAEPRRVSRMTGGPAHPLLGHRLPAAVPLWESRLDAGAPAVLPRGGGVVGAAMVLEAARAAAADGCGAGEFEVEEVRFHEPLVVPAGRLRTLQLALEEVRRGGAVFRLHARAKDADEDAPWMLYASGRLRRVVPGPVSGGAGADTATLRVPAGDAGAVFGGVPAGALEAALEAAAPASGEEEGAWTVRGVRAWRVHSAVRGEELEVRIRREEGGTTELLTDLWLVDASGAVAAEARGVHAVRTSAEAVERAAERGIAGLLYEVEWVEPAPADDGPPADGAWLVLADAGGVGREVAARLEAAGARAVHLVPAGAGEEAVDPLRRGDFDRVLERAAAVGPLRGVLHLWALDGATSDEMPTVEVERAQRVALGGALHLLQALAARAGSRPPRLWLATRGSQAVDGGRVEPAQGPLWGLGAVAALEHPELTCVRVDLDPAASPAGAAEALLEELGREGEPQVAWRAGMRRVARLRRAAPSAAAAPPPPLRPDGTYLVTGGLGALGLRVARALVERGAGHLVLAGRSAPSAEALREIAALEKTGARVRHVRADVSRADDVARLVAGAGAETPLRGVVHAAGVLADGVLAQRDWEDFERVLAPKVAGAWNLHRATAALPLDFFVLFSSAASLLGSAGQGNYAAANAFLDSLAHYRRARGLPALALAWGAWAGGGMAVSAGDAAGRRWAAEGMGRLSPEEGTELLVRALDSGAVRLGALAMDWRAFAARRGADPLPARLVEEGGGEAPTPPAGPLLAERLAGVPEGERRALLAEHVRATVVAVLGLDPERPLERGRPLKEVGLDSLTAVEIRNALSAAAGHPLPATLLFDHPTVDALAAFLAREVFGMEAVPGAGPAAAGILEEEVLTAALAEVEASRGDDLALLLAEELALIERSRQG